MAYNRIISPESRFVLIRRQTTEVTLMLKPNLRFTDWCAPACGFVLLILDVCVCPNIFCSSHGCAIRSKTDIIMAVSTLSNGYGSISFSRFGLNENERWVQIRASEWYWLCVVIIVECIFRLNVLVFSVYF